MHNKPDQGYNGGGGVHSSGACTDSSQSTETHRRCLIVLDTAARSLRNDTVTFSKGNSDRGQEGFEEN